MTFFDPRKEAAEMRQLNIPVTPGRRLSGVTAVFWGDGRARRVHDQVAMAISGWALSSRVAKQDTRPNGVSPFAIERTHPVRAGAQSLT
ncbi:hypothetical protein UA75_04950 [Actinoalloteichus sp. GBA129-24]|uniref:Uncharacterized protein n=1 Tax=Actinoalloteichus fjordicus TaxID=1612552 RepID=A0AAC9L907_9PSEU|nr:hypothetical protein UA74_04835 [Actinoalloteichus fjordicus]APU19019.1 hypothetical protein UA75_04950 [Actinoalloteichus sp. GBA129-24]